MDNACFGEGKGALEVLAFDEFHNEGLIFDTEDGGDVGVAQCGEGLGFAGEAGETVEIVGEGRRGNFEGDIAFKAGGLGAVDFAHAYDTEGRYEPK